MAFYSFIIRHISQKTINSIAFGINQVENILDLISFIMIDICKTFFDYLISVINLKISI